MFFLQRNSIEGTKKENEKERHFSGLKLIEHFPKFLEKQTTERSGGEEESEITVGRLERVGESRELGERGERLETHRERLRRLPPGALAVRKGVMGGEKLSMSEFRQPLGHKADQIEFSTLGGVWFQM